MGNTILASLKAALAVGGDNLKRKLSLHKSACHAKHDNFVAEECKDEIVDVFELLAGMAPSRSPVSGASVFSSNVLEGFDKIVPDGESLFNINMEELITMAKAADKDRSWMLGPGDTVY